MILSCGCQFSNRATILDMLNLNDYTTTAAELSFQPNKINSFRKTKLHNNFPYILRIWMHITSCSLKVMILTAIPCRLSPASHVSNCLHVNNKRVHKLCSSIKTVITDSV